MAVVALAAAGLLHVPVHGAFCSAFCLHRDRCGCVRSRLSQALLHKKYHQSVACKIVDAGHGVDSAAQLAVSTSPARRCRNANCRGPYRCSQRRRVGNGPVCMLLNKFGAMPIGVAACFRRRCRRRYRCSLLEMEATVLNLSEIVRSYRHSRSSLLCMRGVDLIAGVGSN